MIKNLVFDFGQVLVHYDMAIAKSYPFDNDVQREEFYKIITEEHFIDQFDMEEVPFPQIIKNLQHKHPQFEKQFGIMGERYLDFVIGEEPGMKELLKKLKAEGFHLYGMSNWCSMIYGTMNIYKDLFDLLDGRIISCEEHLIKPSQEAYLNMLKKLNINASESVFADDKEKNIVSARQVGMHGIVFQNAHQYEEELRLLIDKENATK